MSRTIAIIGSGPGGCIVGYALAQAGYSVTLYSDRTPEDWLLRSKPTGSAYLYDEVIDIERALGMDHWSATSFRGQGFLLDSSPHVGGELTVVEGRTEFGRQGGAIDQRMRVSRWLEDFESIGGRLVIESVTPERLDAIAAANDLAILAAGKADLASVIPVDRDRSPFTAPQRHLAMAVVQSRSGRHVSEWFSDRLDYVPTKFNQFGDLGEYFWVPFEHKTAGASFSILLEARPGGSMDRFGDASSAEDVVRLAAEVVRETAPWETDIADDMVVVPDDEHAWLKGRFTPAVRQPFAKLPSGGYVIPVADTAIAFDPVCGQGGNFANRSAKFIADVIIARGDRRYDEPWLRQINQDLWDNHGRTAWEFNNTFLEPLDETAQRVLTTAQHNLEAADAMFNGFPRTDRVLPILKNESLSRQFAHAHPADHEPALPVLAA